MSDSPATEPISAVKGLPAEDRAVVVGRQRGDLVLIAQVAATALKQSSRAKAKELFRKEVAAEKRLNPGKRYLYD
jgi:hypothetical protein